MKNNRTVDRITIHADPDAIFQAAANIERWPEILPHYRWVTVQDKQSDKCIVEMAARRGWIPVKWTSIQWLEAGKRRVYYQHTGGATRGMYVEWHIEPKREAVRVTIIHDLTLEVPIVRTKLGKWIVKNFFIKHIAGQTLRRIKETLETGGKTECGVQ